ncbi:ABC transporter permease [Paracoccus sulfuroxidans]|uniref:Microcin C transport system permease protein n=1 Tax=Paracoccus sulfuroxidans TaxID=384678 RepID=A0A562NXB9_9RHOB|nr:ABC transporter permease [Paracoccus sulfuroxidans]TWI36743.1 microcin C transport system permease protein [Paracoccus sulfuroxidans]
MAVSELNQRRWRNFRRNKRAFWSLVIFSIIFVVTLFAELVANDKPVVVSYKGDLFFPAYRFYPETAFGGDFGTEAIYTDPSVQCLIRTGGREECWDDPEATMSEAAETGQVAGEPIERGWMVWPPIPYHYRTINNVGTAPSAPDSKHLLGTDDTSRDVLARVIYGFRMSILFTLIVTIVSSVIGITAGAVQGYFGGRTDLFLQRMLEIWGSTPSLYVIIILFAILGRSFWLLVLISILFGWPALVGVVRAEFLRARNFEYVRAARALGVSDRKIMFRHILPNAMVATLTMLPFVVTGTISSLAALDYLGYGLPASAPSLGELALQAKQNLQAPWLGFTAFFTFAFMLSLLVFIFEGVRDAFDPRKTFR